MTRARRFAAEAACALGVVGLAALALPLATGGTPDPCRALATLAVRATGPADTTPLNTLAANFITGQMTEYARRQGLGFCYRRLAQATLGGGPPLPSAAAIPARPPAGW